MARLWFLVFALVATGPHTVHVADAAGFAFLLKRFDGDVNTICIDGAKKPVAVDTADSILIGHYGSLMGQGRKCVFRPPVMQYNPSRRFPFHLQLSLPDPAANACYQAPVWKANNTDTVSFTAINSSPDRPLSVDGTPVPVNLAPANDTDPTANIAVLPPVASYMYNISGQELLPAAEAYIAWFHVFFPFALDIQATMLLLPDPTDPSGLTTFVGYLVFKQALDGSASGHLVVASYAQSAPATTASAGNRRLLGLRGAERRLLDYYSDGGSDSVGSRNCKLTCVLISPSPPGCDNKSATWPACKFSCRCR